ncbi:sugar ABC transporter substrate-binding protein [Glycomyces sp. TRM65418]|uniref:ABC transporter substrate-binding protein n=1 Tax=Glycomyces sp. TRM65418 TaxID=2867006 RepID=UPI001CE546E4|nr:sugar ABC transporter substrate-binding protein [Glycomyces sp. TRM65418]MCC3764500.1 sugar ABC transporter substrate-binding protein [Glycomyces sp. TRM65418]QZD54170.1 sugar ABC transporter substrate-binding protein [Glycomyces sp. TRM65418]
MKTPYRTRTLLAVAAATALAAAACSGAGGGGADTITIATVANPQMQDMEQLSSIYEEETGNKVEFVVLPENELRDKVTQDIATGSGQYDIVTIGSYEAPIWAENGWLANLDEYASDPEYDVDDLLPPVRESLTYEDSLYAVPFYGESSFLMYRKDLFEAAGVTMPENPTWTEVADLARQLDDPENDVAGICLRGLAGWGEVMAPLDTMIHTFGGRWYDEDWNAQLTSPETKEAVQFYVDLVRNYGEDGASNAGFSECLTATSQGNAAMWFDATVAASVLEDPNSSDAAGKMGYVPAPVMETEHSGWLWAWSLAVPETSEKKDAAWEFMSWATGKDYMNLVGEELGWARVPPGSRASTYEIPEYAEAARAFAPQTLAAIENVDVNKPGLYEQNWTGVQYIGIPEFQDLGTKVGQEISAAIAGNQTVDEALEKAQEYAEEVAVEGGYRDQ